MRRVTQLNHAEEADASRVQGLLLAPPIERRARYRYRTVRVFGLLAAAAGAAIAAYFKSH